MNRELRPQEPKPQESRPQEPRPWIRWIRDHEAEGALAHLYAQALDRAGRVWNILRVMSLRPRALQTSIGLYQCVVQQKSEHLGRAEREMIAVVVSRANQCHYWVQAHCEDLRSEIDSPALADQVAEDWRAASLPAATRAVLAYAEKLTLTPSEMGPEDVTELRDVGLTDEDIHDVVQIASYFNYINRIAAATGVPPEAEMQPWPRRNGEW